MAYQQPQQDYYIEEGVPETDIGHTYNYYGYPPRSTGWSDVKGADAYVMGPPPPQEYHEHHHYGGYERSGDEYYEGGVGNNPNYISSAATEEGLIDDEGHLQVEDLHGVQTITIVPQVSGSLETIANNPSRAEWKISPGALKAFKNNTRLTNRSNATDKDLVGNLSKVIILEARVIDTYSDFDVPIGVNITGLEPRQLATNDAYSWIIDQKSGSKLVKESIHQPENIFTRQMAEKYDQCSIASLKKQIRFDLNDSDRHASVDTQGFVWDVITRNVENSGRWAQNAEDIIDINMKKHQGDLHSRFVDIPKTIAKEVYSAIHEQLEEVEKSFIDMRTFSVKFNRVDGEAWNQCSGLNGEAAAMDDSSALTLQSYALNKPCTARLKIELKYVVQE